MGEIVFFDTEIELKTGRLLDLGALSSLGGELHSANRREFAAFLRTCAFVCGHNILAHDLKYVGELLREANPICLAIDTLPLSPLLFPRRPYHKLLKDDKLQSEELNNP